MRERLLTSHVRTIERQVFDITRGIGLVKIGVCSSGIHPLDHTGFVLQDQHKVISGRARRATALAVKARQVTLDSERPGLTAGNAQGIQEVAEAQGGINRVNIIRLASQDLASRIIVQGKLRISRSYLTGGYRIKGNSTRRGRVDIEEHVTTHRRNGKLTHYRVSSSGAIRQNDVRELREGTINQHLVGYRYAIRIVISRIITVDHREGTLADGFKFV